MKLANAAAFENLINQLLEFDDYRIEEAARYIKTDEREKNWLKNSKIVENIKIFPNASTMIISLDDALYVCTTGLHFSSRSFENTILQDEEINAGLITLLVSENFLKLNTSVDHLSFYDNVLFQHKDPTYKGHTLDDILDYLQPVQIFLVPQNSFFSSEDSLRIVSYMFVNNPKLLMLDFSKDTLETISEITLTSSKNISFNLILNCILSVSYKHAFLELYRLIERIFPINFIKEFHEKSGSNLKFLEFSSELEVSTGWRPKEDKAIERIFETTKEKTKKFFDDFLNSSEELRSQNDATCFYKLRNSIVHFRASHYEYELNENQWNLLIIASLYILDEQYSMYQDILN